MRSQKKPQIYYQPVNCENHKQLKFLQGFHKRLECLIVTQITEVDTTNIKVKQKINIVLLIDKPTTTLKMNKNNIDNFYGSLN